MVRLTLICHAATAATRCARFPQDEPLDARGLRDMAALTATWPPDRCWCSPARRAVDTAEALSLPARPEPLLRDCDFGEWAGCGLAKVEADAGEAFGRWLADPDATPPGGESLTHLHRRVVKWLDAQRDQPGRTVAVTHSAVIRIAIVHALEAGLRSFWRVDIAPLSVTTLVGGGGRWNLASLGKAPA